MELMDALIKRRSIRKYTDEHISEENLQKIIQAGLLSASSRALFPWEFIVVRDRNMLALMAKCRSGAANMLIGADAAILVLGDEKKSDTWVEDCSIAMANMHLMAASLGLGSCWIQCRLRQAEDGSTAEEYLRRLLDFPENFKAEAILSLGAPRDLPEPHTLSELKTKKIHLEQF